MYYSEGGGFQIVETDSLYFLKIPKTFDLMLLGVYKLKKWQLDAFIKLKVMCFLVLSHVFQVRRKLVKDWLPVLIVCKDNVSPMYPSNKSFYLELEETFLRIISTLPVSDAQELLQQCLSFSTRNVEDCPHLFAAFDTWFRRTARPPQTENLSQKALVFMPWLQITVAPLCCCPYRDLAFSVNIVHINQSSDAQNIVRTVYIRTRSFHLCKQKQA